MGSSGQSTMEYFLLIGVVTMVLMFMGTDIKRSLQSVVKVTADQLGHQESSDQGKQTTNSDVFYRTSEDTLAMNEEGLSEYQSLLRNSASSTSQAQHRLATDNNGVVTINTTDSTHTITNSVAY